jgi:predicted  nucleic acid-binding Zn-ribbon protein
MDQLEQLSENIRVLLMRYDELREENRRLREANKSQREEILRSHQELAELETQYSRLRLASAVTGTPEERDAARRRLTQLISQIDHTIEILSQ